MPPYLEISTSYRLISEDDHTLPQESAYVNDFYNNMVISTSIFKPLKIERARALVVTKTGLLLHG